MSPLAIPHYSVPSLEVFGWAFIGILVTMFLLLILIDIFYGDD